MQSMIPDLGMSVEGSSLDGFQRSQIGRIEKRSWKDTTLPELKYLWLQELTKSGRVKMRQVPGEQHVADHLAKRKSWREVDQLIR